MRAVLPESAHALRPLQIRRCIKQRLSPRRPAARDVTRMCGRFRIHATGIVLLCVCFARNILLEEWLLQDLTEEKKRVRPLWVVGVHGGQWLPTLQCSACSFHE
ncbi:hypothetical protein EVAR_62191_1 [Eumeta japonica]|uniref:Uncharacterized protein n=1 Tax=Eumeta variegata TaxID=151549 RepID=A0A4C1Z1C3_EUMVA|nr:hypothetical protein EVAR_62191_1 [Eumeta japonica]